MSDKTLAAIKKREAAKNSKKQPKTESKKEA